jgi:hypothetical protein
MTQSACATEVERARDHGYANHQYAQSLAEFGTIRKLPECSGWVIERAIPNSILLDGMGCYPLFCCRDWSALSSDLQSLAEGLICVSLATDPFAKVSFPQLEAMFPDVCYEYKQHFVTDLSVPLESTVRGHHLRHVRKAMASLKVHQSSRGDELLSRWQSLYQNLIERHAISGIATFSPGAFERQMQVPGFIAFSALERDETCGITLWYVQGEVAYYHLGAYSDRGYDLGASYALFWNALTHFAGTGVRWAALGAGAGARTSTSGLTRFKQGWATGTRPVYFCGRILQPAAYQSLLSSDAEKTDFFPAYRCP